MPHPFLTTLVALTAALPAPTKADPAPVSATAPATAAAAVSAPATAPVPATAPAPATAAATAAAPAPATAPVPASGEVPDMLRDFVDDYRDDLTARPITFGLEVREVGRWHVVVASEDGRTTTALLDGFPDEPVAFFTTDERTLRAIHEGRMASLTAMGKEFSTDYAPLDMDTMPGFQPDMATLQQLVQLGFHFWTRGFPERIPFGKASQTRLLHGAHGTLFYYQEGFRSGFFMIQPGDHVNDAPDSRTNPFPTLLVLTGGQVQARIGDTTCELVAGEAIVIGAGVRHEFWVDEGAAAGGEGIIVMFGEGA